MQAALPTQAIGILQVIIQRRVATGYVTKRCSIILTGRMYVGTDKEEVKVSLAEFL